jgi:hypothetical protein
MTILYDDSWKEKPCENSKAVNSRGYGTIRVNGRMWLRHRWEWTKVNGTIREGYYLLHKCDNKACHELIHLFEGTQQENVDDYNYKNIRTPAKGLDNGGWSQAKLTDSQVIDILDKLRKGRQQKSLGIEYGVSQATISRIKRGKRYGHI